MGIRIMVDMSATLFHHGHVNLLKSASHRGTVVVALTSDEEVEIYKGYKPELSFDQRRVVVSSIKWVDEVVESPWRIDEAFLLKNSCDFLIHGSDNENPISPDRLIILDRTPGISSTEIRKRAARILYDLG